MKSRMSCIELAKLGVSRFTYNPSTGQLFRFSRKGHNEITTLRNGYYCFSVDGAVYEAHRMIMSMLGYDIEGKQIDHINGIRNDNRMSNLRVVIEKDNQKNKKLHSSNTSGFNGVHWDLNRRKWVSQIKINGKLKFLGRYESLIDAVASRIRANLLYGFHILHGKPVFDENGKITKGKNYTPPQLEQFIKAAK